MTSKISLTHTVNHFDRVMFRSKGHFDKCRFIYAYITTIVTSVTPCDHYTNKQINKLLTHHSSLAPFLESLTLKYYSIVILYIEYHQCIRDCSFISLRDEEIK